LKAIVKWRIYVASIGSYRDEYRHQRAIEEMTAAKAHRWTSIWRKCEIMKASIMAYQYQYRKRK